MQTLLAIDVGTTSLKAGLFNAQGKCLHIARREFTLETPKVNWVQLNPEVYWQACRRAIGEILNVDGVRKDEIAAVTVSSQGETVMALDAHGDVAYPAMVWLDNRAEQESRYLAQLFGEDVYKRSGIPEVIPTWSACKILWLKNHEPEVFSRSAKFILVQDFLISRLSGIYVTDGSVSCTTMFYDIHSHTWRGDVLEAVGINENMLPMLTQPGSVVGTVCEKASIALGLSTKTLVVSGGMDQSVGAIGAGNVKPGKVSESTGAGLSIQVTVDNAIVEKTKAIPIYVHSVSETYLMVPVCPTAGMAFKWIRDQFCQQEMAEAQRLGKDAYDLMTQMAEKISAGADGLVMLPHLSGAFSPTINPLARGSFTGFTLSHRREHFIRAVMEGVAFLLKQNLDAVANTGIVMHEIVSTGGGARSVLWNQIKADVCGFPVVTLKNEETGLVGDAILSGVASGIFQSIQEGCLRMVAVKQRTIPGKDQEAYRLAFSRYEALDSELADYYKNQFTNQRDSGNTEEKG